VQYSNNNVDGRSRVLNATDNEIVGLLSQFLIHCPSPLSRTPHYLERVVRQAFLHETLHLFFSEDRDLVGYVVWAYLARETENRVLQTRRLDLHESEWNEGDRLWILDLSFLPGRFRYGLRVLKEEHFLGHNTVRYLRYRQNGALKIIELDRSYCGAFFRSKSGPRLCRCQRTLSECAMMSR
jgi:hemolysin-activating ACP:hemolysin acyltransferase